MPHPAVRCNHGKCRGDLVLVTVRSGAENGGHEYPARSCTRCGCTVALVDQDELLYAGGGGPLFGNGSSLFRHGRRIKMAEG